MDNKIDKTQVWPVWVDWDKSVVSFQEATGFKKLEFSTHDEMFQFAIEKTVDGFAIQ